MNKGIRLSEKWFNRALWAVAFMFAWFLTGLAKSMLGDLPQVETQYSIEHFVNHVNIDPLRSALKAIAPQRQQLDDQLDQASLQLTIRQKDYQAMRSTFDHWVATRDATQLSTQDDDLVKRTQQLEAFKGRERHAETVVEQLQQKQTDLRQHEAQLQRQINSLEDGARIKLQDAQQQQAARVFLYRLLLTLPLLAVAAWLFAKKRQSQYWPFVWGFIMFALMAFFVELVPYLPDYGGYVRYLVGIVLTAVGGKYAIAGLQAYLAKQRLAESQPEFQRREALGYDTAMAKLGKSICPGCERQVDVKSEQHDFCMHCGICLHNYCAGCHARKNAFAKFCHQCGTVA